MLDLYMVYQFIRRLATPFREWDAYKLNIIDARGNVLISRDKLSTRKEKEAFGAYDLMLLNIKKMLEKVPGGQTRLASYAAALFLLQEWKHFTPDTLLTESVSDSDIRKSTELFFSDKSDYTNRQENVNSECRNLDKLFENTFGEEAPTVNVGGGNVAGLGVGPNGEPGLTTRQAERYKKKNKLRQILKKKGVDE